MLFVFALPIDAAYAQVTRPTPDNPVCFTTRITGAAQCYPDMAACQAAMGASYSFPCADPEQMRSMTETLARANAPLYKQAWNAASDIALSGTLKLVGIVIEFIAKYVTKFAGIFMRSMGHILDMSIDRTIDTAAYNLPAVILGWTAVRDFSNMFFIFVLLYIAIQTILGLAGGGVKRLLSHVVIAALLINFSLFFTQVVIDAGNILAMGFWNQMTTQQGSTSLPSASAHFLEGFRFQSIFDTSSGSLINPPLETNEMSRAMIYAGGALVMFVAGYVFLAGAVMMIVRTVWLLILMIASPFAFLSFALPSKGGFASWWWSSLVSQAFVAPAFLFMLYICSRIVTGMDMAMIAGATDNRFAAAILGNSSHFAIIYQFVLIIILLLASLTVANKVSAGAGSMGGVWAKKIIGGGAALGFTGSAAAGRQVLGRSASASLKNKDGSDTKWAEEQRRLVAKGGMTGKLANARLALAEKGAKSSYDIRNAPMGGLGVTAGLGAAGIKAGTGSKRTYETHGQALSSVTGAYRGTEKEKELIATAKSRFPDDPAAQKAYLEQRGVVLAADRNKDIRTSIEREGVKKTAKETLEEQAAKQGVLDKKLSGNLTPAEKLEAEIEGKAIAAAVGTEMRKLNVTERAEMAEKYKGNAAYINNLNKGDFATIHRLEAEGKYKAPVLQGIVEQVMKSEDAAKLELQKYLMKDETQDKLFTVDYKHINQDRFKEMQTRAEQSRIAEKAAGKAARTAQNSGRFQELFAKTDLTPAEQAELKTLSAATPSDTLADHTT